MKLRQKRNVPAEEHRIRTKWAGRSEPMWCRGNLP